MKRVRWLHASLFVTLLASSFVFFTPDVVAQKVHALLVIMDGEADIGTSVDIDRKRVEKLLSDIQNKNVCRVKINVLESSANTATANRAKQWIKDVRPADNDVLFVYYSGHGGMLRNETFIVTQGNVLFRKELVKAMERAPNCRLKILIVDACSNAVDAENPTLNPDLRSTLTNLFVEHKGFLNLAAATEGEYAWSNDRRGGWFTSSLIETIYEYPDPNGDNFVSWEEVFKATKKKTMDLFSRAYPHFDAERKDDLRRRNITSQTPRYYGTLPKKVGN